MRGDAAAGRRGNQSQSTERLRGDLIKLQYASFYNQKAITDDDSEAFDHEGLSAAKHTLRRKPPVRSDLSCVTFKGKTDQDNDAERVEVTTHPLWCFNKQAPLFCRFYSLQTCCLCWYFLHCSGLHGAVSRVKEALQTAYGHVIDGWSGKSGWLDGGRYQGAGGGVWMG